AQDRSYPDFGSIAKTGGPAPENAPVPAVVPRTGLDAAVERTRQEVKMLDDLFKNAIVLIDGHYVKKPSDFPAATAAKALWAALKKDGWYDVRILGLTDVIGDPDDAPRDAFEQAAAKKLLAGQTPDEEVVKKDGKRYLRVVTGIPVVSENCVMCHENFNGNKGNVGALSYTVPMIE
ncbi:MAG: c-type heme family protein, partial [Methylocella sp.]